jgi:hypothetical protein
MADAFVELQSQDNARDLSHAEWLADRDRRNAQTTKANWMLGGQTMAKRAPAWCRGSFMQRSKNGDLWLLPRLSGARCKLEFAICAKGRPGSVAPAAELRVWFLAAAQHWPHRGRTMPDVLYRWLLA